MNLNTSNVPTTTKVTPVMIYTHQSLIWGKVATRPAIRVSIWLQTEMAPLYMRLMDTQILLMSAVSQPQSFKYSAISVHTHQINAYHILPPVDEAPYYDPDEPNRKMESVAAIVGNIWFEGQLRMSEQTNMDSYLNVSKSDFMPLFDVKVSCPLLPSIREISAPLVLIRQTEAIFVRKE